MLAASTRIADSATSVAAASDEPPPNPPPAGMRFCSWIATGGAPSARAARTTRFVSSVGIVGSSHVNDERSDSAERQRVVQRDRLEDRLEIVKAVGAFAGDAQRPVDLGVCADFASQRGATQQRYSRGTPAPRSVRSIARARDARSRGVCAPRTIDDALRRKRRRIVRDRHVADRRVREAGRRRLVRAVMRRREAEISSAIAAGGASPKKPRRARTRAAAALPLRLIDVVDETSPDRRPRTARIAAVSERRVRRQQHPLFAIDLQLRAERLRPLAVRRAHAHQAARSFERLRRAAAAAARRRSCRRRQRRERRLARGGARCGRQRDRRRREPG